jgi:ribosomal protein S27E
MNRENKNAPASRHTLTDLRCATCGKLLARGAGN